jgi:hypothetical protein
MLIKKAGFLVSMLAMPWLANAATGELWDVKMKSMGMEMPVQQICMAKDKITEKDVQSNDECHNTSFKALSANHVKFTFACKDGSTGDGDISRDSKSFKQVMNMVKGGEKMTMNSEGKNTGQTCDPDAGKKQADAALAKGCEDQAKEMVAYPTFFPSKGESMCAKYKGAYCDTVKTAAREMDGNVNKFQKHAFNHGSDAQTVDMAGSWQKAVKACGAGNPDSIQKNACNDGIKTRNWQAARFVCKSEVDAIYARECVGRDYTANPVKAEYRTLCPSPSGGRDYTADSANSAKSKKKSVMDNIPGAGSLPSGGDALEKAKKLKDVFGF